MPGPEKLHRKGLTSVFLNEPRTKVYDEEAKRRSITRESLVLYLLSVIADEPTLISAILDDVEK